MYKISTLIVYDSLSGACGWCGWQHESVCGVARRGVPRRLSVLPARIRTGSETTTEGETSK